MSCVQEAELDFQQQSHLPTWCESTDPMVLTEIYQRHYNMVIWKRDLSAQLQAQVSQFVESNPTLQIAKTLEADDLTSALARLLPDTSPTNLLNASIADIASMFSCLFELRHIGFRLKVLDRAMCPRFHVDRVPCRLVTTFAGDATQWLPHECVRRQRLGHGSDGLADNQSGLYASDSDIKTLKAGDVALLKGELWEGNENSALVHRSPDVAANSPRLLLSLDYA